VAAQGRAIEALCCWHWDQARRMRPLLPGGWGNGDRVGMWEVLGLVLGWFAYCADLLIGPRLLLFFGKSVTRGYEPNYLDKVRLPETQDLIRDQKFRFRSLKT